VYERKAVAIKWYTLPDGHRKYKKEFEDYFSCFLPNWVYDKYMIQRKKYLKDISDELKVLRNRLKDRQQKFVSSVLDDVKEIEETPEGLPDGS